MRVKLFSGMIAVAALLIASNYEARADTLIVTGTVVAPTGPDSSPSTYGYDNGGYFGSQFANLGGLPFTVTWTGTDCNCYSGPTAVAAGYNNPISNITGATITINGITVNLMPFWHRQRPRDRMAEQPGRQHRDRAS